MASATCTGRCTGIRTTYYAGIYVYIYRTLARFMSRASSRKRLIPTVYETRWLGVSPIFCVSKLYLKSNLFIVCISCLLWNSTRPSCRNTGGRVGDGGRRVDRDGESETGKQGGSETD